MQGVRDPSEEDLNCASHDQPVDSYSLIPYVVEVLLNIQMQGYAVPVVDLPPTRNARFDQMPLSLHGSYSSCNSSCSGLGPIIAISPRTTFHS